MSILALGAHYDDIEIGCGMTVQHHINNDVDVYFAILECDEYHTGDPKLRLNEQYQSLDLIKLPHDNLLRFESGSPDDYVIGVLDQIRPTIIFTQWEKDTHQAHRRCSNIGQAVGRKKYITTYFYESGSGYEFYPNVFNPIDIQKKLEILRCFQSQIDRDSINIEIIKRKNAYWGSLISKDDYAEAFLVRKLRYKL